jgi:hypothetical protein
VYSFYPVQPVIIEYVITIASSQKRKVDATKNVSHRTITEALGISVST